MTNGEKIQSMFPNMNFGTLAQDDVIVNRNYSNNNEPQVFIPKRVWNAEYKEPTKSCRTCRSYKGHAGHCEICHNMSMYKKVESTTKNDSAHNLCDSCTNIRCEFQSGIVRTKCAFYMPPQHSSGLEKNSKKLEKDFGELDCISRAAAIQAMQDKAKKLTNEDTINGLCGAVAILFDLPSVTPQEPIIDKIRAEIEQIKLIMNDEIINHNRKDLINFVNGLNQSLNVIDKYKGESEDK